MTLYQGIHPVSELRMFGEGYQPRVSLESPLIDPRGTRTLTSIEWDADTPPGTRAFLQTRTGSTKSEVTHYFNGLGEEVTAEKYDKLKEPNPKVKIPDNLLKGEIVTEEIMGSDASAWSDPVPGVGQPHHLAVAAQLPADARHPGLGQSRGGRHPAQRAPEVRRAAGGALRGGGWPRPGSNPWPSSGRFPCMCGPTSGAPTPASTGSC